MSAAAALWFAASDEEAARKIVTSAELGKGFNLSIATHKIFYTLCGMALELAYKAIIIENGKESPQSHDLLLLAELAGFNLSHEDKTLLNIWSQLIIWDGKYPIPKKEKSMDAYSDLIDTALWNPIEGTPFKRMNNRIQWSGFRVFWDRVSKRYFEVCDLDLGVDLN